MGCLNTIAVSRKDRTSPPVFDVHEAVRVLEVGPFQIGQDKVSFRLDVLRHGRSQKSSYSVRVWRYDTYRIHPSFGRRHYQTTADEEFLVLDVMFANDKPAPSANAAIQRVLRDMSARFGGNKLRRKKRPSASTSSESDS